MLKQSCKIIDYRYKLEQQFSVDVLKLRLRAYERKLVRRSTGINFLL